MRSPGSAALLLFGLACGGDKDDAVVNDTAATYAADCSEVYTWETVGAPFTVTWCTSCHSSLIPAPGAGDTGFDERQGAPEGLDFDTREAACAELSAIESAVFGERMPPAGGPSEDELAALRAWIDCGAPGCD